VVVGGKLNALEGYTGGGLAMRGSTGVREKAVGRVWLGEEWCWI
jgi:hypothetical protein